MHETGKIKNILTESMNVYSAVKETKITTDEYLSAKAAADKIAKNISDKYVSELENKVEITSEESSWNDLFKNLITKNSSGMILVDFNSIDVQQLSSLLKKI